MQHCDTLIAPRWCIPLEPGETVLKGHAIAVNDGRIMDILPLEEARRRYQPSVVVERPTHVVIPGLVNAHCHAAMTLLRGIADDLPLEGWLRQRIWPLERRWASAEMVRDGTELAIAEMLRSGTTCFGDQYFFPEVVAETAAKLNVRAVVATPVADFPSNWANNAADYLDKGAALVHDPYAGHPLVSTAFSPHTANALDDDGFTALRVMADQLDRPVQIHLHESAGEIADHEKAFGNRPIARLDALGLLNASLLAVHAVHLTAAEIERLSAAGVRVVHCPRSNLKLGNGVAPLTALRKAGIVVGLGTDGAASSNALDPVAEMQYAALLARGAEADATACTALEALEMATLGGARALGLDAEVGSLRPGKQADLACIDLGYLNTQPVYDPLSHLVFAARADQVTDVWVAGRHQLENGRLAHIDTDELLRRADTWRVRIEEALSADGN